MMTSWRVRLSQATYREIGSPDRLDAGRVENAGKTRGEEMGCAEF